MKKQIPVIGIGLLLGASLALGGAYASAQGEKDTRPQMQRGMGQGGMMGRPMMMRMHRMMAACERMMGRVAANPSREPQNDQAVTQEQIDLPITLCAVRPPMAGRNHL